MAYWGLYFARALPSSLAGAKVLKMLFLLYGSISFCSTSGYPSDVNADPQSGAKNAKLRRRSSIAPQPHNHGRNCSGPTHPLSSPECRAEREVDGKQLGGGGLKGWATRLRSSKAARMRAITHPRLTPRSLVAYTERKKERKKNQKKEERDNGTNQYEYCRCWSLKASWVNAGDSPMDLEFDFLVKQVSGDII